MVAGLTRPRAHRGVGKGAPYAFFLGAGSVSSRVPSAYMCVWQRKREIVRTEELGLEEQLGELSLPAVYARPMEEAPSDASPPERPRIVRVLKGEC